MDACGWSGTLCRALFAFCLSSEIYLTLSLSHREANPRAQILLGGSAQLPHWFPVQSNASCWPPPPTQHTRTLDSLQSAAFFAPFLWRNIRYGRLFPSVLISPGSPIAKSKMEPSEVGIWRCALSNLSQIAHKADAFCRPSLSRNKCAKWKRIRRWCRNLLHNLSWPSEARAPVRVHLRPGDRLSVHLYCPRKHCFAQTEKCRESWKKPAQASSVWRSVGRQWFSHGLMITARITPSHDHLKQYNSCLLTNGAIGS